jgi:hypothetical protein
MNIAWYIPDQMPLITPHFTLSFLLLGNIMADVANKQQTTVLFLSTTVTHTHKKTNRTDKKNWQTWWEKYAVSENIQFSFPCSLFYAVKLHSLT